MMEEGPPNELVIAVFIIVMVLAAMWWIGEEGWWSFLIECLLIPFGCIVGTFAVVAALALLVKAILGE